MADGDTIRDVVRACCAALRACEGGGQGKRGEVGRTVDRVCDDHARTSGSSARGRARAQTATRRPAHEWQRSGGQRERDYCGVPYPEPGPGCGDAEWSGNVYRDVLSSCWIVMRAPLCGLCV